MRIRDKREVGDKLNKYIERADVRTFPPPLLEDGREQSRCLFCSGTALSALLADPVVVGADLDMADRPSAACPASVYWR